MAEGQFIVVVDDDPGMCSALNRLFVAAGMHVKVYRSGRELIESGTAPAAGCFVLDIQLPDMSGFELLDLISSNRSMPPVIFITAYDQLSWQAQATARGARYFTKPFSGHELVAIIRGEWEDRPVPPQPSI
jgi:FixJ family two-component response regulator